MFFRSSREKELKRLVQSTVQERAPENSGTSIVDSTIEDYRKLLALFLEHMPGILQPDRRLGKATRLLDDPIRAIIMLRAWSLKAFAARPALPNSAASTRRWAAIWAARSMPLMASSMSLSDAAGW